MKIVRVYQPDKERQLQALLLLLSNAPLPRHPASDDLGRLPNSSMGFEATDPVRPTSQPVDETCKDNDLPDETGDGR